MNISELFFFKVFPCQKLNCVYNNFCYFYHAGNDKRRLLFDFENIYFPNKSQENQTKNKLIFYNNQLDENALFSNKNNLFCVNFEEKNFHILNYQEDSCDLDMDDFECPNKLFCYKLHKNENSSNSYTDDTNDSAEIECKFFLY